MQNSTENNLLTIISFNLKRDFGIPLRLSHKWLSRRKIAAQCIRESGATIIGVQELLPSMREDVRNMLNEDYSIVGFGRFCGKKPNDDEHSDIIVKNSDAKISNATTFWLSKHPEQISRAYYAMFPRICTVAEVELKNTGRSVRVFNTHLDHICGVARLLGVEVILQYMRRFNAERPMPNILMGDFNCKPDSRPVKLLRDHVLSYPDLHLTDAYSTLEPDHISNTLHNFSGKIDSGARPIDYIFASDELEFVNTHIVTDSYEGFYPSDHYPLMATLRFREHVPERSYVSQLPESVFNVFSPCPAHASAKL